MHLIGKYLLIVESNANNPGLPDSELRTWYNVIDFSLSHAYYLKYDSYVPSLSVEDLSVKNQHDLKYCKTPRDLLKTVSTTEVTQKVYDKFQKNFIKWLNRVNGLGNCTYECFLLNSKTAVVATINSRRLIGLD